MKRIGIALLCAFFASTLTHEARAASFVFAWSGFLEPEGDENPWQLDGDGSGITPTDGTPFTVSVRISASAQDLGGGADNFAAFWGESATLTFGDQVFVAEQPGVGFWDNRELFDAVFDDSISISFSAVFFGATLQFGSTFILDPETFAFDDPSNPYTVPHFDSTISTRTVTTFAVNNVRATVIEGTPISVTVVPLPPAAVLLMTGVLSLVGVRKRSRRQ